MKLFLFILGSIGTIIVLILFGVIPAPTIPMPTGADGRPQLQPLVVVEPVSAPVATPQTAVQQPPTPAQPTIAPVTAVDPETVTAATAEAPARIIGVSDMEIQGPPAPTATPGLYMPTIEDLNAALPTLEFSAAP